MINEAIRRQIPHYRDKFANARPFRHVVIDDFFEADRAKKLLEDFPPFASENAKNEFGRVGRKAVVTDIRKISPFYAEVDAYIASREFLDCVSQVTGIPDLVHDELMFGGGTHENLEGQELDPHVDFNFIEDRKLHRRLNLLLYLNKEWEVDWGGCLELHSNPRRPDENRIQVVEPVFNRCVVFETSEFSWHGFKRIHLPEGKKDLSRKLLSIYLYTRDRPAGEIVAPHGTFYVQRPKPAHLVPGHTLTEEDARQIEDLLRRRDGWIEFYQKKELADSQRLRDTVSSLDEAKRVLRIPLTGPALQEGPARGFWADGWIGSPFEATLRLLEPVGSVILKGHTPQWLQEGIELSVWADGTIVSRHSVQPGPFLLEISTQMASEEFLKLGITSGKTYCAGLAEASSDRRELVVKLDEIRVVPETAEFQHLPGSNGSAGTGQPALRIPLTGSGVQEGRARGYWQDGWIGNPFEVRIRLQEPIDSIAVQLYLPGDVQPEPELSIRVNGAVAVRQRAKPGLFSLEVRSQLAKGELLKLGIASDRSHSEAGADRRDLVIVLTEIRIGCAAVPPKEERPRFWKLVRNRLRESG